MFTSFALPYQIALYCEYTNKFLLKKIILNYITFRLTKIPYYFANIIPMALGQQSGDSTWLHGICLWFAHAGYWFSDWYDILLNCNFISM
jgi:hypothetical protein